jgi:hypothetical protein
MSPPVPTHGKIEGDDANERSRQKMVDERNRDLLNDFMSKSGNGNGITFPGTRFRAHSTHPESPNAGTTHEQSAK